MFVQREPGEILWLHVKMVSLNYNSTLLKLQSCLNFNLITPEKNGKRHRVDTKGIGGKVLNEESSIAIVKAKEDKNL